MSDVIQEMLRKRAAINGDDSAAGAMLEAADLLDTSEKIIAEIIEAAQDAHDELVHGAIGCRTEAIEILKEKILNKPWIKTPE